MLRGNSLAVCCFVAFFFASVARKEGYEQIGAIFEETSANEKEHAELFFKHLKGGMAEITASYPAGVIGKTVDNLKAAAAGEKLEAWYHLTGNISYPLMVILSVILFPAMIVRYNQGWFELLTIDLPLFILSFSSVSTFYITSQKALHKDWLKRIIYLPGLMAVGIGMTIPGSKAVLEGAFGFKTPFVRTPKFSVEGNKGEWMSKKYRCNIGFLTIVEILFGIYFVFVTIYAWNIGIYGVIPFLLLFMCGYLYTGLWALVQGLKRSNLWDSIERFLASIRPYSQMTDFD